jgi:probable rRNA maturation factor
MLSWLLGMEINILIDEDLAAYINEGWLQKVASQALSALGADPTTELGLVITDQEKIQKLNSEYLGRNEPTDVLAFSMLPEPLPAEGGKPDLHPFIEPPDGVSHLGEVIISYPQAVIQAQEQQHSVEREIAILVIHGILHLMGYRDDTPEFASQMKAKETEILSRMEEKGS